MRSRSYAVRPPGPPQAGTRMLVALLALAIYSAHAAAHLAAGTAPHLLFLCNVALPLVAAGWLLASPGLLGVGAMWLAIGLPLWAYGAATAFGFDLTSIISHGGGAAIGAAGIWRMGLPAGTWWRATLAIPPVFVASRLFTPPAENVNLAFRPWPPWEPYFPSHALFLIATYTGLAAAFFAIERAARRLGVREPEGPPPGPPSPVSDRPVR